MFGEAALYLYPVDFERLEKAVQTFLEGFDCAIQNVLRVDGKQRPGKLAKHEHFGFRDGISQPAMRYSAQ